ncbi:hypothetical protein MTR67_052600 [Solanum verrucosum]|uniref:Uncharacterized protein n=1 Tax=Solanum verrucosum TaxID=315347 RepID=A0AAF0V613_SOLVR|nr:hypothetical protein MTR67_052600 [Solanum verrucosum]
MNPLEFLGSQVGENPKTSLMRSRKSLE